MKKTSLLDLFLQNPVISTDSRDIPEGCIFFAIKGENFDGNVFAKDALDSGAAHAVVSDPALENMPGMILVKDTLKALQSMAAQYRALFRIPFLAVCGSNGKNTRPMLPKAT
jgi:UDP-N-acetylmuramoyl-tripeptide--D-alanyl-D-alanine ligase